jgi:hypothetical protein
MPETRTRKGAQETIASHEKERIRGAAMFRDKKRERAAAEEISRVLGGCDRRGQLGRCLLSRGSGRHIADAQDSIL